MNDSGRHYSNDTDTTAAQQQQQQQQQQQVRLRDDEAADGVGAPHHWQPFTLPTASTTRRHYNDGDDDDGDGDVIDMSMNSLLVRARYLDEDSNNSNYSSSDSSDSDNSNGSSSRRGGTAHTSDTRRQHDAGGSDGGGADADAHRRRGLLCDDFFDAWQSVPQRDTTACDAMTATMTTTTTMTTTIAAAAAPAATSASRRLLGESCSHSLASLSSAPSRTTAALLLAHDVVVAPATTPTSGAVAVDDIATTTTTTPSPPSPLHQQHGDAATASTTMAHTSAHATMTTTHVLTPASRVYEQHMDANGSRASCVVVVDPQRRKLTVPLSAIQPTRALRERVTTPSLCLLYLAGNCRQGANCFQVHASLAVVQALRTYTANLPSCCAWHGDHNQVLWRHHPPLLQQPVTIGLAVAMSSNNNNGNNKSTSSCNGSCSSSNRHDSCAAGSRQAADMVTVPFVRLAYTAALHQLLQEQRPCVYVNVNMVCRLHGQQGYCRFGADCHFLHICRDWLQRELAELLLHSTHPAPPLPLSPSPSSTSRLSVPLPCTHAPTTAVALPLPLPSTSGATAASGHRDAVCGMPRRNGSVSGASHVTTAAMRDAAPQAQAPMSWPYVPMSGTLAAQTDARRPHAYDGGGQAAHVYACTPTTTMTTAAAASAFSAEATRGGMPFAMPLPQQQQQQLQQQQQQNGVVWYTPHNNNTTNNNVASACNSAAPVLVPTSMLSSVPLSMYHASLPHAPQQMPCALYMFGDRVVVQHAPPLPLPPLQPERQPQPQLQQSLSLPPMMSP